MVIGVETAGLVLGSIPLLLAGLEFYAKGIAVTKRCFRYKEQFQNLIRELSTENVICTNNINLLLVGVVRSKDMAEFLANPCGDLWKDAHFDQKLKQRLGSSFDSYIATIQEISRTTTAFQQRLKLNASGKPQFTDEEMFRKYYKRLEFSIRKADYDDLMAILRRANTSLSQLTTQSISLENMQNSCKLEKQPTPRFNAIHGCAQGFSSALTSSWKCHCHADHSVSLRLEPRFDDVQSDDDDIDDGEESMRHPFHVIFRYGHDSSQMGCSTIDPGRPWAWEEADVRITVEKKMDATTPSTVTPRAKHNAKVRFASQAKNAVRAALQPEANLRPIQDLCAAISTLQTSQRDACLSLLAHEYAKQKYGILIYPSRERPTETDSWSTSTLQIGEAMSEFNTADRLVDELYNEAGGKYSDAVRRCIRCDFDRRANSLEDLGFQQAVYEGVVAQLKENFDFLY
ncbi:hypothetical protein K491DRAFT_646395 [Lophiostoma macrostomum CBS 122681]|uniref:Uncharacterized protein n=1 Tax=Lophiostoma macrostomum CBS 122681 TaxID=1314788 RepID=A0A6A6TP86_9PLEO|nr:hypothetical protein K491DRAFT_646395 [Lophiostoma macrostomum CBS 122681]